MKNFILAVLISCAAFARADEHHHADAAKQLYTCGMHPQVVQDHPGDCPICGMKLVPLRRESGGSAMSNSAITIDPVTQQQMNVRTAVVTHGAVTRVLRTFGKVATDETKISDVTARYKGVVGKVFANVAGESVQRGEPLFEIYSLELYDAQVEFLTATWLKPAALNYTESSKTNALARLKFLGLSAAQITELQATKKPQRTVTITSPMDGIVMEKMFMSGQSVDDGMKLYRLADLGTVWLLAQISEQDLPLVKRGQAGDVTFVGLPGQKFSGHVTHLHPMVDERSHTAEARLEFPNPDLTLKPGMTATVELRIEISPDAVLVPDSAVLRSGERNTVFVALDGGKFDAREVTLGARGEGNAYQVLSGVSAGERVVTSGQFLLDSESQLREAIEKMRQQK
jgi:RND family efflux transporter MFP subunit